MLDRPSFTCSFTGDGDFSNAAKPAIRKVDSVLHDAGMGKETTGREGGWIMRLEHGADEQSADVETWCNHSSLLILDGSFGLRSSTSPSTGLAPSPPTPLSPPFAV